MKFAWIAFLLCLSSEVHTALLKRNDAMKRVAVQFHDEAGCNDINVLAEQAAAQHGYRYLGALETLRGYHLFEELPSRKRDIHTHISEHHAVKWAADQHKRRLAKRQHLPFSHSRARQMTFTEPLDPQYSNQWHLRATPGKNYVHLNVLGAWKQGVYGENVLVSVVDDGVQYTHPDIMEQFDQRASFDWNDQDHDVTPHPRLDDHGTPAAGLCCGARNGKKRNWADEAYCGVGVAYMARVAGLRLIATDTEDWQEGHINWGRDHVDVYSNSWGPTDDGNRLEGPGKLATAAVEDAIANGRDGKGSIYVFAGGNGRTHGDNCNYDGWANWRYTITIAAVTHSGKQAWYSEDCSCLIASVPSSGEGLSVTTTDLLGYEGTSNKDCTSSFSGTSAAAPMAAGAVALILDAHGGLGWRDVQAVIIESVMPIDSTEKDWQVNGAGHNVSHHYGFGLMDVGRAVKVAKNWSPMQAEAIKVESGTMQPNKEIPFDNQYYNFTFKPVSPVGHELKELVVEHVEVYMVVDTNFRGALQFFLTSPSGTVSRLQDFHHDQHANIQDWRYQTIFCWGESPVGEWTLSIANSMPAKTRAFLRSWQVILYTHQQGDGGLPSDFEHYVDGQAHQGK